ncbi:MAG: hypothetical protein IJF01_03670 [Tidjanibacter sp.]|nr:hypothetical protein [Tidjanibacter sp.]
MKKLLLTLLLLTGVCLATISAASFDYVVIYINGQVCLPVTVNTDKGTFTIRDTRSVTLRAGRVNSAYDCRGDRIIYKEVKNWSTSGDDYYSYQFTSTYSSSSDYSSGHSSSYSSGHSSAAYGLGQALGMGLASLGDGWDDECYRLDLAAGYGYSYGGYGVAINYQGPLGFGFSFGYGKNPNYGEWGEHKKNCFYAGIQIWPSSHWNIDWGVGNCFMEGASGMVIGTNLQFPITERLGIRGGIAGALTFERNEEAFFLWNIGLVWRLFAIEW